MSQNLKSQPMGSASPNWIKSCSMGTTWHCLFLAEIQHKLKNNGLILSKFCLSTKMCRNLAACPALVGAHRTHSRKGDFPSLGVG
mmetsp:Transcript_2982/g.7439  ORF Transcript_2982/g.7439 Transcript_2982/m.7439 type:complete len:85 (+) Transcript_2982:176-430(+)